MLHHIANHIILAAPATTGASTDFWSTSLGSSLAALMKAAAILIVLFAVFRGVKDVLAGKVGKAVQLVIGALLLVALLWDPQLIGNLIDTASGLFSKGADTTQQLTR